MARVNATRLLNGLRLLSLDTGGGGCLAGGDGPLCSTGPSSNLFLPPPPRGPSNARPPFLSRCGLGDRRAARRFENGLGLRSVLCGRGDLDPEVDNARLDPRSSAVSMRSALLLLDRVRDVDIRLGFRLPCLPLLLLRSLDLLMSREPPRPRCSGLNEVMRRLVLRSRSPLCRESTEDRESMDTERLLRFPLASCFWRWGGGEREGLRLPFVEIVETESTEEDLLLLLDRFLPRSSSFFFKMSSATPFLRTRSLGTSVVSLGLSCGLRSCCVRDGRDL